MGLQARWWVHSTACKFSFWTVLPPFFCQQRLDFLLISSFMQASFSLHGYFYVYLQLFFYKIHLSTLYFVWQAIKNFSSCLNYQELEDIRLTRNWAHIVFERLYFKDDNGFFEGILLSKNKLLWQFKKYCHLVAFLNCKDWSGPETGLIPSLTSKIPKRKWLWYIE